MSPSNPSILRRYRLIRPTCLADYERLEKNSLFWDTWGFHFTHDWFSQSKKSPTHVGKIPYWQGEISNKRINPHSTNWTYFLLMDDSGDIVGRLFSIGVTREFRDRHLSADCPDALLPLRWEECTVPNPAHPSTCDYVVMECLTDISNRVTATPLFTANNILAELFQIQTVFSQVLWGESIEIVNTIARQYGYREIRQVLSPPDLHPGGEKGVLVNVWAWERDLQRTQTVITALPTLGVPFRTIAILADFYQQLTHLQRITLISVLKAQSREEVALAQDRSVSRVNQVVSQVRDIFMYSLGPLAEAGLTIAVSNQLPLSSLLLPVSQVLRRLAWFYGDSPPATFTGGELDGPM